MTPRRRRARPAGILLVAVAALAGCAVPQEAGPGEGTPEGPTIVTPETVAWQDAPGTLPDGARVAVLSGDPTAAGPFTMRVEVPPGTVIPPHVHPDTERVTVLSGAAFVGRGETIDRANATALPPGSYFLMPAGTEHWFSTGDERVVLQLHGEGPWGIEYLDAEGAG